MRDAIFRILFFWYPYFCLTTFFIGSLIRFDRDQYSWKAGSSQMLRRRQLYWGSNLFHFGILFLVLGHTVGLLTPTSVYTLVMTVPQKQIIAVVAGGIAGVICFIGLTLLLHRRLLVIGMVRRCLRYPTGRKALSRSIPSIRRHFKIWSGHSSRISCSA
jgi:nitrate reductase gamma subunit